VSAGFRFEETMRGSYYLLSKPQEERAIEFSIEARVDNLRRFMRDLTARIRGVVTLEGLCKHANLDGTLGLKLLKENRLPYDFSFTAEDGKKYRVRGEKNVVVLGIMESLTTLPASVYDDSEEEIGRAVVRFDLRSDWRKFLFSFRPRLSVGGAS
jgi:hypothetical protein